MKRFIVITLILLISVQLFYPKIVAHEGNEERQVIPDEAIRLRILANSNDERDQEIKREVRDAVSEQITEWVQELTSVEKARQTIKNNMLQLEELLL